MSTAQMTFRPKQGIDPCDMPTMVPTAAPMPVAPQCRPIPLGQRNSAEDRIRCSLGVSGDHAGSGKDKGKRLFAIDENAQVMPVTSSRMIAQLRDGNKPVASVVADDAGAMKFHLGVKSSVPFTRIDTTQERLTAFVLENMENGRAAGWVAANRGCGLEKVDYYHRATMRERKAARPGRLNPGERLVPGNRLGVASDDQGRRLFAVMKGRSVISAFALTNAPEMIGELLQSTRDFHYRNTGHCPWENVLRPPVFTQADKIKNPELRKAVREGRFYGGANHDERIYPKREIPMTLEEAIERSSRA